MKLSKVFYKEKNLINFIRYGAMVLVLFLSYFITNIFIENTKKNLENDSNIIEKNFIEHNKNMVENLVNKFYQLVVLEKEFAQKELDQKIKEQIYQAHAIATAIYKENITKENYSKQNTITQIKTALKEMRFNSNLGYMFIYTMDGTNILNAEFPSIEGKNLWNHKDAKGTLLLQDMNKLLTSNKETYYEWYWKKSKDDPKQYKKRGFFKRFEPYGLFIGTGDYVEEFERRIKQSVLKKINSFELKKPEHIFIYTLDGTCLSNPKKELIGKNRYNTKNKNGKYVLREILEYTQKNKEGFVRYKGSIVLNEALKTNDKISFVKLFSDWNWMIGSGFYLEELYLRLEEREALVKQDNEKTIKDIIIYSSVITIFILIFSFYISKIIFNIFDEYKVNLKKEMDKTIEKEKLLSQQSKMATMGEMIGNIAHQWKQPLGLISMSNGIIKLREEEQIPVEKEAINNAIENIDSSVVYLSNTIDDFRNFFKPDKQKKFFYFDDIFEKTYKLIDTQFKNNNIQIISNTKNLELYGYENEFLQVLINLIKNSKDELVKIDYKQKKLLFINTYTDDTHSIIEIKDNAGGVDEKIIDKIFEPYFTTKEDSDGTGIGLYMSRQLIEGMHGKISVENVSFEYEDISFIGAKFSILLPLKRDKEL